MKHKRVAGNDGFMKDCSDSSLLMCLALSESTLFENLQLN